MLGQTRQTWSWIKNQPHHSRWRSKRKYELLNVTYRKLNVMTYLTHYQLVVLLDFALEANQPQLPPSWFFRYPIVQVGIKNHEAQSFRSHLNLSSLEISDKKNNNTRLHKFDFIMAKDILSCTGSVYCWLVTSQILKKEPRGRKKSTVFRPTNKTLETDCEQVNNMQTFAYFFPLITTNKACFI